MRALDCLRTVPHPEIPVLDVISMGIVREIDENPDGVRVTITPTYSGCPAMKEIESSIRSALNQAGFAKVEMKIQISPPWTTDWITKEALEKLRSYGIAPPKRACNHSVDQTHADCPYCGSVKTQLQSEFGSTPCKSLHVCKNCHQPFESFKCI